MAPAVLCAAICVSSCAAAPLARDVLEVRGDRFSGEQAQNIRLAWRAVQRAYEPTADLASFSVTYAQDGSSTTISFFKPNTVELLPDGRLRIVHDSLWFQAVVTGGEIRVLPLDQNTAPPDAIPVH